MKIYLIRHGQTKGNREGRYVGSTDEPLLPKAREKLAGSSLAETLKPDILCVSPLRRCRETARILFPGKEQNVVDAFRECDFGEFEYRNYEELNGNPDYQRFIDSGGTCGFPGGEPLREFKERCARAFRDVIASAWEQGTEGEPARGPGRDIHIVLVVHGGTIMAILDAFSCPHKGYFGWQTGNGKGYGAEVIYNGESGELALEHIVDLLYT